MPSGVRTYRFKLAEGIQAIVSEFARTHAGVPRAEYKSAWQRWLHENKSLIDKEETRLQSMGYEGNLEEKMFKSGRYYFRRVQLSSKADQSSASSRPAQTEPRRHVPTSKRLRDAMDAHIRASYAQEDFKPARGYTAFKSSGAELMEQESQTLQSTFGLEPAAIENKLKRTYKNRYFLLRPKLVEEDTPSKT